MPPPHGPISADAETIPGTRLHRRWCDRREIAPLFDGSDWQLAIEQAARHGYGAVACDGSTYAVFNGRWYVLHWLCREDHDARPRPVAKSPRQPVGL